MGYWGGRRSSCTSKKRCRYSLNLQYRASAKTTTFLLNTSSYRSSGPRGRRMRPASCTASVNSIISGSLFSARRRLRAEMCNDGQNTTVASCVKSTPTRIFPQASTSPQLGKARRPGGGNMPKHAEVMKWRIQRYSGRRNSRGATGIYNEVATGHLHIYL